MRNFFVAMGVLALGVALSGSVMAQGQSGHKRVLGYQDSETGEFHPLEKVVPEVTTAPTTGEFEVTFTITLKSTVPTGGSVLCSTIIEADVVSLTTATGTAYTESSNSVAKVTGTTATCTVNTPYSWVLPAASTTTEASLSGAYTVSIVPAPSSTISLAAVEGRSSASSFLSSKTIPATGTISKLNVAATL
jgi:hypothetical protein